MPAEEYDYLLNLVKRRRTARKLNQGEECCANQGM